MYSFTNKKLETILAKIYLIFLRLLKKYFDEIEE